MRILITNDDGIHAEGIRVLAELALDFGEVTVVAPKLECSGMSHRITFMNNVTLEKADFPVEGVKEAWQVDGTPADCIMIAMKCLFKDEKPDIVFSGINNGYNSGTEILYSGTVGGAMEALVYGVPAIAYSIDMNKEYGAFRHYFREITERLLARRIKKTQIWNVNVPGVPAGEIRGILYGRTPAHMGYYYDHFDVKELPDGSYQLYAIFGKAKSAPKGTDIAALIDGYISVGKLRTRV